MHASNSSSSPPPEPDQETLDSVDMIDNNNLMRQRRIIWALERRVSQLRDGLMRYADESSWTEGSRGFNDLFLGCKNGVDLANIIINTDEELERSLL